MAAVKGGGRLQAVVPRVRRNSKSRRRGAIPLLPAAADKWMSKSIDKFVNTVRYLCPVRWITTFGLLSRNAGVRFVYGILLKMMCSTQEG